MLTQDDLDRAIERHDNNESWQAIATSLGVSRNILRDYVNGDRVPHVDVHSNWIQSAACVGEDPQYFEYEPGRDEEAEDALARYELAKEVCQGCPVKAQCATAATGDDRQWTTRGGLMPLQLRSRLKVA